MAAGDKTITEMLQELGIKTSQKMDERVVRSVFSSEVIDLDAATEC